MNILYRKRYQLTLDEDLHATTQTQHKVQCALLLNVVVRQSAAILQLLASKDQTLLVRWDALLVLDLLLHVVNGVRWLHIKSDGLASQSCNSLVSDMIHVMLAIDWRLIRDY